MTFLKLLQTFSGVEVKRRNVPHKILYNFALRCKNHKSKLVLGF